MGLVKKILILGGTGFIGMSLLRQLRKFHEEFEVLVIAHRNTPYEKLEDFNVFTGDLARLDFDLLDRFQPDMIIHMARLRGKGVTGRYLAARIGSLANKRLIRHLYGLSQKPVVIYISGTLVYGDHGQDIVDETSPLSPVGYSRQYSIAEEPWVMECRKGSLPVIIMRPPWIVGKQSWFKTFFTDLLLEEKKVPVYGDGSNWMPLIDLEDCAGLIIHGIRNGEPGKIYNIFNPSCIVRQLEFSTAISTAVNLPLYYYREKEIVKRYGKAAWESLTFSLKTKTMHIEWLNSFKFGFPDLNSIIINNIS
ncbi:MAG TPA: NAD(P)-dependent oxidoreductase [Cyclobacteriaceae bacterium]|nr:NAD(P)-dependent oxidoreductase [Cyclobacteriaceae bacterium]